MKNGLGSHEQSAADIMAMIRDGALDTHRLKQDRISMKIEELLLATGEAAHVDTLLSIDAHSFEG
jgi:hypothetical protein